MFKNYKGSTAELFYDTVLGEKPPAEEMWELYLQAVEDGSYNNTLADWRRYVVKYSGAKEMNV